MSDEIKTKATASLLWKLLEMGGSQVATLLVGIAMARLLMPSDFGAVAIITVFVNLCGVFVTAGLGQAIIQAKFITDRDLSTVFWLSFGVAVILNVAMFPLAVFVSAFYEMPELTWPLRSLMLGLLVNSFSNVQYAIIIRDLDLRKSFWARIAAIVFSAVFGIALAFSGAGIWALVAQSLTSGVASCAALALQVRWRPRLVFDFARARTLFSFSWKILASSLLNTGYNSLSDLIIGKMFSASDLGLVNRGKGWPCAVATSFDGALSSISFSAISHVQDNMNRVKSMARRWIKTSIYVVAPFMGILGLVAEPLTIMLIGDQWRRSVSYMQIYCVLFALWPIASANTATLRGIGRSDISLLLEIAKKACGLLIILITAFVFKDVFVMVLGFLCSTVISALLSMWANQRYIGYSWLEQVRDISPAIAMTLVSITVAFPISFLEVSDTALVFLQVVLAAIVYLGLSRMCHVETFQYLIATIKEMINR